MKIFSVTFRIAVLMLVFAAPVRAENEITQIKLQRTQCYGPCPIDQLTLNADGSAQFNGDKNSVREGFYRGKIAPEKFAMLARALEEENFFELRPKIGHLLITDVPDIIISATRKGALLDRPYTVASRGGAPLINRLQNAFDKASAQIEWTKNEAASKAGINGTLTRDLTRREIELFANRESPIKSLRLRYALVQLISAGETKTIYATRSDNGGNFQLFAPPGKYLLSINDVNEAYDIEHFGFLPSWLSDGKWIEIGDGQILPIEMQLIDHNIATAVAQ